MSVFSDDDFNIDPGTVESLGEDYILPEAFYKVTLDAVKQGESKGKGTPFIDFTFKVVEGKYKDREVKESLFLTANEKSKARKMLFAHRLGLVEKFKDGDRERYKPIAGKEDFQDCIGAVVVVHVEIDANDKPDDSGKTYKPKNRLAFGGIYDPSDKKLPELIAELEEKLAGKKTGKTAGQSKGKGGDGPAGGKGKFDDL